MIPNDWKVKRILHLFASSLTLSCSRSWASISSIFCSTVNNIRGPTALCGGILSFQFTRRVYEQSKKNQEANGNKDALKSSLKKDKIICPFRRVAVRPREVYNQKEAETYSAASAARSH